jgi:hypothetical protein
MSTPKSLILWTLALVPFGAATLARLHGSAPTLSVPRPALPALAFDQYLVDLGPVQPSSEVRAHFVFRHRGAYPAKILDLKPSCGCLQPRLQKDEYAPGESDVLVLRVLPANEAPGKHEYFVDVKYADPEVREVRVTFRVQLPEKGISVTPPAILVYQFSDRPTVVPVVITDTRNQSWTVHGVSVTLPFVNVAVGEPKHTAAGTFEVPLEAAVAADVPPGRHHGVITVHTDNAEYPELKIPVLVQGRENLDPGDATEEHSVP